MDFNRIGRKWVGSVYHKFEAIRQDVDDFATKDTVKYLENRVQTIGEGVKNVYANVLPDVGNYTRSAVGIIGMHMFSREGQSCMEEDSAGLLDCNDHPEQFNPSTSAEFPEKPNEALNPEDAENNSTKDEHSICKDLDSGYNPPSLIDSTEHPMTVTSDSIERNSVEHPTTVTLNSIERNSVEHPLAVTSKSVESKSVPGLSENSDIEVCMSNTVTKFAAENLVDVVEFKTNHLLLERKETPSLRPIIPFCKISEMSAQTNASNEDIPVSEVRCSVEEKDNCGSSFHIKEKHLLPLNLYVLQENSLCKGLSRVQIDKTMCKSKVIGGDLSSEMHGDATNFDERHQGEGGDDIWIYSNSIIEENQKLQCGVIVHGNSTKGECSSDLASADICESSKRVLPFDESMADKYNNCSGDSRLKSDMLTSNSGCGDSVADIEDFNLETIDLEDKVKLEEGSIMVDDGLVHAALYRPRRFRSYKALVLDAFASRKRLIKEYEQLAILYGEIDADVSQQERVLFHPVTAAAFPTTDLQSSDSCEPEWELV